MQAEIKYQGKYQVKIGFQWKSEKAHVVHHIYNERHWSKVGFLTIHLNEISGKPPNLSTVKKEKNPCLALPCESRFHGESRFGGH